MVIDKGAPSPDAAVAGIESGASIAVGGFGLAGIPWILNEALHKQAPLKLS
jgi:3-oxoacid CoA-transferase subunit A